MILPQPWFSVNHTTLLSSTGLPRQPQKACPKTNVHIGRRFLAKICFFIQKTKKTNNKSTPAILPSPGRPPQLSTQRLPDQAGGASSSPGRTAKTSHLKYIHIFSKSRCLWHAYNSQQILNSQSLLGSLLCKENYLRFALRSPPPTPLFAHHFLLSQSSDALRGSPARPIPGKKTITQRFGGPIPTAQIQK